MQYTMKDFLRENYSDKDILGSLILSKDKIKSRVHRASGLYGKHLDKDEYLCLNTLGYKEKTLKRDKEHIRRLKFLYVDLDTYRTDYSNEQILMRLESDYFNQSIPTPSYVVSSGRGMYLLWRIDEHIYALPRWKTVQRYLYSILKEFGADSCVTEDHARVFRMIGSKNSKSSKTVKVIWREERIYTLYEIMEEFFPVPKKAVSIDTKARNRRYIPLEQQNRLFIQRMGDLKTLLTDYRDKEGAYRENILFLYRYYHLCLYGSKESALKATLALNGRLNCPLPEKEAVLATSSAEKYFQKGCSFRITSKKMVTFLNLTEEEIAKMPSILTEERQKEKKRAYNRTFYGRQLKEKGKTRKKEQTRQRAWKMLKLMKEGKTKEEIQSILKIKKSVYYEEKKIAEKIDGALKSPKTSESCKQMPTNLLPTDQEEGKVEDFRKYAQRANPGNAPPKMPDFA